MIEWIKRGRELLDKGKYDRALKFYDKVIENNSENSEVLEALERKAEIYYIKNELTQALEIYKKLVSKYESIEDKFALAEIFRLIGNIYTSIKKPRQAIDMFNKCLEIHETNLDPSEELFFLLYDIGDLYYKIENYREALEIYKKILKLREEQGPLEGFAEDFSSIARIYFKLKKYNKSTDYYEKALEIYEISNDQTSIALTLLWTSKSLHFQKRFDEAYDTIIQAIGIFKDLIRMELQEVHYFLKEALDLKKTIEKFKTP
jgi:tetratricopeptide (TPR) repeat protein